MQSQHRLDCRFEPRHCGTNLCGDLRNADLEEKTSQLSHSLLVISPHIEQQSVYDSSRSSGEIFGMLIRPCGDCQFSSHPPLQGNLFQRWLAKTNGDSLSRDRQNQSEHDEAAFKDTLPADVCVYTYEMYEPWIYGSSPKITTKGWLDGLVGGNVSIPRVSRNMKRIKRLLDLRVKTQT